MQNLFLIEILSLTIQAECISNFFFSMFFSSTLIWGFFFSSFVFYSDVKSTEDKTRWNLSELCVFRNPWCKNSSDLPLSMQKYKTLFCWLLSDSWSGRSTFSPPLSYLIAEEARKESREWEYAGWHAGIFVNTYFWSSPPVTSQSIWNTARRPASKWVVNKLKND